MLTETPLIRTMRKTDLASVIAIQRQCYPPAFQEPIEAFESKLTASPDTCWVSHHLDQVCAYLVCLPIQDQALPVLHAKDFQISASANWLYIHDLAIGPNARGTGLASQLLRKAVDQARDKGLTRVGLIAVQGSEPFWAKFGFNSAESNSLLPQDKLNSFGSGALFMHQTLS